MTWLTRWFRRTELDRDLDDELRFHVEAHARDLIAQGLAPDEARRRALAAFGGLQPIREQTRDTRGSRWLTDLVGDVRYAVRTLRRNPAFATVAILTLTLGIGANTAIFSVVNAVLLRPLPVHDPSRLVLFSGEVGSGTQTGSPFPEGQWSLFSTETYRFLAAQPTSFDGIAAFESGDFRETLADSGTPNPPTQTVTVKFVSGNYFQVMGASAARGRTLEDRDDHPGAPPVAIVSDRFWRDHFGGEADAIGRTVTFGPSRLIFTIAGVMPAEFFGERVQTYAPDLWVPISQRDPVVRDRADYYWLSLIGRLAPGQTMATAQARTTGALRQFLALQAGAAASADTRTRVDSVRIDMVDGSRGLSYARAENGRLLGLLLSAVGVILLIACANIGTLLLARASSREREIAVRRALGAGRARLIRQWMTESLVVAVAGAACGMTLARYAAPLLLRQVLHINGDHVRATMDPSVLLFTTGATVLACLLFGLAPALRAGRVDPAGSLRVSRGGRRPRLAGLSDPFLVMQIALALVLVVGASLLVRTLLNLERAPYGFDQDNVLFVSINPRPAGYGPKMVGTLYQRLRDRLTTIPGIERVTFARFGPFGGHSSRFKSTIDGYEPQAGETVRLFTVQVGPDYPATFGMPLLRGRAIGAGDVQGTPDVAMVNETFVKRYLPAANPLGRHVSYNDRQFEIVGVIADAQFQNAREPLIPMVFVAMLQETTAMALDCEMDVRTQGSAAALIPAVREAVGSVDSRVRILDADTYQGQVRARFAPERTAAGFIVTFAIAALLVASVGLYGVVSYGLARRTNELAVRIALGAGRGDVVRLVARETMVRIGAGLVIGLALAELASSLISAQLFGVTPMDPVSLLAAAAILVLVSVLAVVRPVIRAMSIDPIIALRQD